MSIFTDALRKAAGAAGKVLTTVGTAIGAPRLGPNGAAVGASLQNYGGNSNMPFAWVTPAYAAENTWNPVPTKQYDVPAGPPYNPTKGGQPAGVTTSDGSTNGPVTLIPPTSGQTGSQDDIGLLKSYYDQARQAIEAQGPQLEQSYNLAKGDIENALTDTQKAAENQKQALAQTYGDLLRNQLQTYQDLNRQRQGVFSSLGTLDSSAFGEQQLRADQAFGEQRAKTEQQQASDIKSVDDAVLSYKNQANSILGQLALQYQAGKNQIAQALAQGNLDEAAAIKNATDQIRSQAQAIQNSVINFANQAALLKAQGYNVKTSIGGITGADFAKNMSDILTQSLAAGKQLYTLPATNVEGQGYIGPDGKRYASYDDYLRKLLQGQA